MAAFDTYIHIQIRAVLSGDRLEKVERISRPGIREL